MQIRTTSAELINQIHEGCDFQGADSSNGIIAEILGGKNKLSAASLRGALPGRV